MNNCFHSAAAILLFALAMSVRPAAAQVTNPGSAGYSTSETSAPSIQSGVGTLNQNPFAGSVVEGKVSPEVLPLSFKDAIDRGL